MKAKAKFAPYPNECPDNPDKGTIVTAKLDRVTDNPVANMYASGFFLLGGVTVNMIFDGTYTYKCCDKKAETYDITLSALFSENVDGFIPWIDDEWTDTHMTFQGSLSEKHSGSF